MSLPQLHYTSAAPGPGGTGFRFTATSPEVPPSLLQEAAGILGYEPPRSAPARPDPAELVGFPVAFSHTRLADGSTLLSRAVYTGTDYSGRWGNFHAHAVHLAEGGRLQDGLLPVEAWGAPEWAAATPSDPVLAPLERFTADVRSLRDGLAGFAADRAPWLAGVFADARALALDPAAPRTVLVEADTADVVRWIALVGTVLPPESARRLTFTSYTRRPQKAPQQLIGVLPEEAATLAGIARDRRYRVHTFDTGVAVGAGGGADADAWADTCARIWIAGRPEVLARAALLPPQDHDFAAGRVSAAALASGVELSAPGRAAACEWAAAHHRQLHHDEVARLVRTLCAAEGPREHDESRELLLLHRALSRCGDSAVPGELTMAALMAAVRRPELPLPEVSGFAPGGEQQALLADELVTALVGAAPGDPRRALDLLDIAEQLGIDCGDALSSLAEPIADLLLSTPLPGSEPSPELTQVQAAEVQVLREAVKSRPALRGAVLRRLDVLAAADPVGFAYQVAWSGVGVVVPAGERRAVPNLALCLVELPEAAVGEGSRLADLRVLLAHAGAKEPFDLLVLSTAVTLIWESVGPTPSEEEELLAEYGPGVQQVCAAWPAPDAARSDAEVSDAEVPGHQAHEPDSAPKRARRPLSRLGRLLGGRGRDRDDQGWPR